MFSIIKIDFSLVKVFSNTVALAGIGPNPDRKSPQELEIRWQGHAEKADLTSLLSWHCKLSEFAGRHEEMQGLKKWADGPEPVSIKFVCGDGGTGKSRLGAEFAEELLRANWTAGFVDLRKSQCFPVRKAGTLLIVDYPEENRHAVLELLKDLAATGERHHLRVLFLTRQTIADWDEAIGDGNARALADRTPINLGRLDSAAAHKMFCTAQKCAAMKFDSSPVPVSEGALVLWLKQAPENDRALFIVALALHSALNEKDNVVRYTGRQVVEALAVREIDRLRRTADEAAMSNKLSFALLLSMAAIAEKIPVKQIEKLASRNDLQLKFPENCDVETVLKHAGLLSGRNVIAPKPDIVAAALAVMVLREEHDRAPEYVWGALEPDIAGGLDRIARLCYDSEITLGMGRPCISDWLAAAVRGKPERAQPLDKYVWDATIPLGLQQAGVAVYQTLLEVTVDEEKKARLFNNLSGRLSDLGDRSGALAAIREAVDLYRRLAQSNPAAFEPALATSLNNLSAHLSDLGDRDGALPAIREAADIYRRLAQSNPTAFEPALAASLNNLSGCLNDLGDREGALPAIREAVDIYRRVAQSSPAVFEPGLAMSLNNLSNHLGDLGDHNGALTANQESVDIRRRLAQSNPAAFEPALAVSLNNLSLRLSDLGDRDGALAAIREAADIYRRLAQSNPAAFEPYLARSLSVMGMVLMSLEKRSDAIDSFRESIALLRPYVEKYPASEWALLLKLTESDLRQAEEL